MGSYSSPLVSRRSLFLVLLSLLFLGGLIQSAWLCDDAYITLRTVDHFVNGYGLRWNASERVQTYTHPLWMFLVAGVYFLTREAYFSTILLSIGISFLAVALFTIKVSRDIGPAIVGLVAFLSARSFIDYSTSGLEGPLIHLILVLFFLIYLRYPHNDRTLFLLSLTASAGTLTRLDLILLFLPPILHILIQLRQTKAIIRSIAGFTPLILWTLFSLFYYGVPVPNTAYAKLITGLPHSEVIAQGTQYLFNSLSFDPLTLVLIASAFTLSLFNIGRKHLPFALGGFIYLVYIVWVGGDFMTSRLLTPVFLVAVFLLTQLRFNSSPEIAWSSLSLVILLLGLLAPFPSLQSSADYRSDTPPDDMIGIDGIADERGYYFQSSGLMNSKSRLSGLVHPWAEKGKMIKDGSRKVVVLGAMGFTGYYAGPEIHILDWYALADPLLSKLPPRTTTTWRIGHLERNIPCGYLETLESGVNQIENPHLAAYYDKVSLVTRGRLFDLHRLFEIWNLNRGKYAPLLRAYLASPGCQVEPDYSN